MVVHTRLLALVVYLVVSTLEKRGNGDASVERR